MKHKKSTNRFFHSSNDKIGMGNYYCTAIKQKIGRMREEQLGFNQVPNRKVGKPPKSLA